MKNTTFRKKALLSSVAMLLVAIVALGSATFAWFSSSTTANAHALTASTAQSSNLVVSEQATTGWTQDLTFTGANIDPVGVLSPVTTLDFEEWKTTTASVIDAGVMGNGKTLESITSPAGVYYVTTPLYVMYDATEGSLNTNLQINVTDKGENSCADYLRVALVAKTDNTLGDKIYGNAQDDYAKTPAAFTDATVDGTESTSMVTNTSTIINLGNLTAGTPYGYDVYVYYEGTDPDCLDKNATTSFEIDFKFVKA